VVRNAPKLAETPVKGLAIQATESLYWSQG
jgi:hypothetical protein